MYQDSRRNRSIGQFAVTLGLVITIICLILSLMGLVLVDVLPPGWRIEVAPPYDAFVRWAPLFGILLGLYCFVWGLALLARRAWGAYQAALGVGILVIVILGAAYLWYDYSSAVALSLGGNPLQWQLLGIGVALFLAGLLGATWRWLLFGMGLRQVYAEGYSYSHFGPPFPVCDQDGVILGPDGSCFICDLSSVRLIVEPPKYCGAAIQTVLTREKPVAVIGRSAQSDLAFPDEAHFSSLSGRHAEIAYDFGRRVLSITDVGSRNGTTFAGKKLSNGYPQDLDPTHAVVELGGIAFTLHVESISTRSVKNRP